ncbi:hypothetical protein [Paludibaculum fermentans]|uniref:Uncharacterized protein n=1 Tax=Paludibaculum fermentans TaxID=1473598 RepID=A0A7S7NNX0_PALFE|nr:hypothetical protein [Paludibaculum fermentans]QOY86564.1 hypothetical protein IRI77_27755 [Paludibaculum fermentans]
MAALPLPKYGLDKLYLFPYYQTRAQYTQATGEEPPPFDEQRPPQYWCDPEALKSTKRSVIYENILAVNEKGVPLQDENGRPYFEPVVMLKLEAGTVNIPMQMAANEPGTEKPAAQIPLRELDPDEELFFDFGGIVLVRNKTLIESNAPVGFTPQDRELLKAVARKLNVPV